MNEVQAAPHAADYAEKKATRVRVFTPSGVVEGLYHHPPGVRLSDSLRNSATGERYMMLTDVEMRSTTAEPGAIPDSAPFVLISSSHASLIVPLEDS